MFCEENYLEQDNDIALSTDPGYDRFLSLVASQVSSSPRKQFKKQNEPNKLTNNLSVFASPNLPEQCVTSFADNLQENMESNSRIYENSVIKKKDYYNNKHLPEKENNIPVHIQNIEQFVNPTKILVKPEIINNVKFLDILSKFAAPPKKRKSEINERSDQSRSSKDAIVFPNVSNAAESQKNSIPPNTNTNEKEMSLHTTNQNTYNYNVETQWPNHSEYCHNEEPPNSQMSTHSKKIWKLTNDVTVPSNTVDLPKNWDSLITHKNIIKSHPTKIGNGNPNKLKSSVKIKNKFLLSEMTIDETDKAAYKKRFNQLKLSDMLPAKKLKNIDCKKSNKTSKPAIEIISDVKIPSLSTNVNKNISMWLNKINEFADTELLDGMDFIVEASNTDIKNKTDFERDEVINGEKRDNKDRNVKPTDTKSIAIVNKVQTVIANDDGKMKYKKMNEAFEYLPLNQPSCSQLNSKKKSNFVPPIKRDVPKKNINYSIENLDQESIVSLQKLLSSNDPVEIGITALFRFDSFHYLLINTH